MDTAEHETLRSALKAHGQRILSNEDQLAQVRHEVAEASKRSETTCTNLSAQLNFVIGQLQGLERLTQPHDLPAASSSSPSSPAPSEARSLHLSCPERFYRDSGDCRPFFSQCELHFEFQAAAFPSDHAKIAYIISYLSGRAKAWATSEWSRRTAVCNSLPLFSDTFKQIFHSAMPGREAAKALHALKQG